MNAKKLLVSTVVMCALLWFCSSTYAKYRGPDTRKLTKVSDIVCIAQVTSVRPASEESGGSLNLYSLVSVKVLDEIKGTSKLRNLTIGTVKRMDNSDHAAYCEKHQYLLFLNNKGTVYQATYRYAGVFEKSGEKIQGWPRQGEPSFPKANRSVGYQDVRKEILNYVKSP